MKSTTTRRAQAGVVNLISGLEAKLVEIHSNSIGFVIRTISMIQNYQLAIEKKISKSLNISELKGVLKQMRSDVRTLQRVKSEVCKNTQKDSQINSLKNDPGSLIERLQTEGIDENKIKEIVVHAYKRIFCEKPQKKTTRKYSISSNKMIKRKTHVSRFSINTASELISSQNASPYPEGYTIDTAPTPSRPLSVCQDRDGLYPSREELYNESLSRQELHVQYLAEFNQIESDVQTMRLRRKNEKLEKKYSDLGVELKQVLKENERVLQKYRQLKELYTRETERTKEMNEYMKKWAESTIKCRSDELFLEVSNINHCLIVREKDLKRLEQSVTLSKTNKLKELENRIYQILDYFERKYTEIIDKLNTFSKRNTDKILKYQQVISSLRKQLSEQQSEISSLKQRPVENPNSALKKSLAVTTQNMLELQSEIRILIKEKTQLESSLTEKSEKLILHSKEIQDLSTVLETRIQKVTKLKITIEELMLRLKSSEETNNSLRNLLSTTISDNQQLTQRVSDIDQVEAQATIQQLKSDNLKLSLTNETLETTLNQLQRILTEESHSIQLLTEENEALEEILAEKENILEEAWELFRGLESALGNYFTGDLMESLANVVDSLKLFLPKVQVTAIDSSIEGLSDISVADSLKSIEKGGENGWVNHLSDLFVKLMKYVPRLNDEAESMVRIVFTMLECDESRVKEVEGIRGKLRNNKGKLFRFFS